MEANAAISGLLVVAVEIRGAVVGGHQYVEIAVAIEIGVAEAAADFWLDERFAGGCGHVLEFSLAVVEEKLRRLGVANVAADVADGVVDVAVGDDKIQGAVEVGIEERAAEAESVL